MCTCVNKVLRINLLFIRSIIIYVFIVHKRKNNGNGTFPVVKLTIFIFTLNRLKCPRCVNGIQTRGPPLESDCTDDFSCWHHCAEKKWVVDPLIKQCWSSGISFIFYQNSQKQIPVRISFYFNFLKNKLIKTNRFLRKNWILRKNV